MMSCSASNASLSLALEAVPFPSNHYLCVAALTRFTRIGLSARRSAFQRCAWLIRSSTSSELWSWLEEGAHLYVCGDAKRMARDVDAALLQVIQTVGGRGPEQAAEYVARLKSDRRYQRDVY